MTRNHRVCSGTSFSLFSFFFFAHASLSLSMIITWTTTAREERGPSSVKTLGPCLHRITRGPPLARCALRREGKGKKWPREKKFLWTMGVTFFSKNFVSAAQYVFSSNMKPPELFHEKMFSHHHHHKGLVFLFFFWSVFVIWPIMKRSLSVIKGGESRGVISSADRGGQ